MRVDTGIILSVLSFSVFAAVIPSNDYYVPLLVRRAVSPENRASLWKRADEEQEGSYPSGSGASSGGSSSNHPSSSRGLIEGRQGKPVIDDISKFLKVLLESAKLLKSVYYSKVETPFASSPQKFSSSKSLARELARIQSTARELIKAYLKDIYTVIASIIKHPQNVMSELEKIMSRSTATFESLKFLWVEDYVALVLKMKHPKYSEYNQIIQEHVAQLKEDQDRVSNSYSIVESKADSGVLRFKEKTPSKISALKSRIRGG
ncbi:hypothetical protein BASA61_007989 [Batrachochytrium salamandrivorans]|nr:hypothetical protein BASA61_007989 [Batrachochytrium salamandrivorans]